MGFVPPQRAHQLQTSNLGLDYSNLVLAGLPKSAIMPLQRVQNAAAPVILDLQMNELVTPVLRQLHWLPVDRRLEFKLCTMMHSIHTVQCPTYSSDTVHAVAVNQMRSCLRSADSTQYIKPRCRILIRRSSRLEQSSTIISLYHLT